MSITKYVMEEDFNKKLSSLFERFAISFYKHLINSDLLIKIGKQHYMVIESLAMSARTSQILNI